MLVKLLRWTFFVPAWTVFLAGVASCASHGGQVAVSSDLWLAEKGFETRGDWGSAALHLRGQQMRSTFRISQLIRRVPDVRLQPTRDNPLGLSRVLDEDRGSCVLPVYLNGVRMAPRDAEARVDLDARVGVPNLDALELHLGPDGPVYDPGGCGSLLLWDESMQHVRDPEFSGSIRGQVESDVADAVVGARIGASGLLQRPDSAGFIFFSGLLPGEYEIEFVVQGRPVVRHRARVYAYLESRVELGVRERRKR
jgi:hypothetical protein